MEIATRLLILILVGAFVLVAILWPRLRRLRELQRENEALQRKHDELVSENRENAQQFLDRWAPPGGAS